MDDKKLLAQALGYYLKAHVNKDDKMAQCFPEKWASDIDLQLAFKKGWKEAEDETPVVMNVSMDFTKSTIELMKELRELRGEIERMHSDLLEHIDDDDTDDNDTAMVRPGVYVTETDKTVLPPDYYVVTREEVRSKIPVVYPDFDLGSHAPGRHTWEAATGKTLDDFAVFYKIGPRAPGEADWQLRMRIKYAHEFQHPARHPGLPLEPKYTGLDVAIQRSDETDAELVKRFMGQAEPVSRDADGNISGAEYFDAPGVNYNEIEERWRTWQDANKKAFSKKEAVQIHNVIKLDGSAIAKEKK